MQQYIGPPIKPHTAAALNQSVSVTDIRVTWVNNYHLRFGKCHAAHDVSLLAKTSSFGKYVDRSALSVCLSVCHQFLSDTITEKILQISS